MNRAPRLLAALVLVAGLFLGCTSLEKSTGTYGDPPETEQTASTREKIDAAPPDPPPPSPAAASSGPASHLADLYDQNGARPAGIPVSVVTPKWTKTVLSDAKGRVTVESGAGDYRFSVVAGCTADLRVLGGTVGARPSYAPGAGPLKLQVQWEHRIAPWGATYPSIGPYWPLGEEVTLLYQVSDRCTKTFAPDANFSYFRFEPTPNLNLVGEPALSSGKDSKARVDVVCREVGETSLVMRDSKNAKDEIDLIHYVPGPRPTCGDRYPA